MTGQEALNLVMFRLGNRTAPTLRAAALLEMKAAQERLELSAGLPWFLEKDITTLVTVVGNESVALPADYLRFDDEWGGLFIQAVPATTPDAWAPLTRDFYLDIKAEFADSGTAQPQKFDIVGATIKVRPYPNAVYPMRLMYYGRDVAVADSATTNLWLTHAADVLIAETCVVLAGQELANVTLATELRKELTTAKTRFVVANEARKNSGRMYAMGDD